MLCVLIFVSVSVSVFAARRHIACVDRPACIDAEEHVPHARMLVLRQHVKAEAGEDDEPTPGLSGPVPVPVPVSVFVSVTVAVSGRVT